MIRLGIAGAGLMGWAHSMALRAMIDAGHLDAGIEVVHDIDPERSSPFAELHGAHAASGLGELVERCDALWVCTPTATHTAIVEAALDAGRAVFCEKPLAPHLSGATALARAAAESPCTSQVGLVLRSSPAIHALRSMVASGELGEVMTLVLRDDQYFPVQGLYGSAWRGEVEIAGGGCLIEHSIHDLDLMRFCLGEVVRLSASTADFSGRPGVEDLAVVTLHFRSGAVGELVSVWHDILSRGSTRRLELFCRRGLVWLDNEFTGPLHVQRSDDEVAVECPWPDWVHALPLAGDEIGFAIRSYAEADRSFVEAVIDGRPASPSFADALEAHRIVDATYRSAAAGGAPVDL